MRHLYLALVLVAALALASPGSAEEVTIVFDLNTSTVTGGDGGSMTVNGTLTLQFPFSGGAPMAGTANFIAGLNPVGLGAITVETGGLGIQDRTFTRIAVSPDFVNAAALNFSVCPTGATCAASAWANFGVQWDQQTSGAGIFGSGLSQSRLNVADPNLSFRFFNLATSGAAFFTLATAIPFSLQGEATVFLNLAGAEVSRSSVPEPSVALQLAVGLIGLGVLGMRRKK